MPRLLIPLLASLLFLCSCGGKTALNPNYDLSRVRRIGIMAFGGRGADGVDDLFAKHMIAEGFTIIERARLARLVEEQRISSSGLVSPETARDLGKVLGVDAMIIGDVVSLTGEKHDVTYVETRTTSEEPVYTTETVKREDGTYTQVTRRTGTKVTRETARTPQVYSRFAQAGLAAKLVDVETGEIVWAGSYTDEGVSELAALDGAAQWLVEQLARETKAAAGRKKQ